MHVVNELGQLIFSEWYGSLIVHACVHVHACIIVYMHVCIVSLTRVFRYQTQHHCHGIPCREAGGCVQEQYTGSNSFPWRQTHGPLQSLQLVSWSVVCALIHQKIVISVALKTLKFPKYKHMLNDVWLTSGKWKPCMVINGSWTNVGSLAWAVSTLATIEWPPCNHQPTQSTGS